MYCSRQVKRSQERVTEPRIYIFRWIRPDVRIILYATHPSILNKSTGGRKRINRFGLSAFTDAAAILTPDVRDRSPKTNPFALFHSNDATIAHTSSTTFFVLPTSKSIHLLAKMLPSYIFLGQSFCSTL